MAYSVDFKLRSEDFKALYALPLENKIGVATAKIIEFYNKCNGNVYISFSGGIDSTVLAHLVHQLFPDVQLIFAQTGNEYPDITKFCHKNKAIPLYSHLHFADVLQIYGYVYPNKQKAKFVYDYRRGKIPPSWLTSKTFCPKNYMYLVDSPFAMSPMCCDILKKEPLNKFLTEKNAGTFVGSMAVESLNRWRAWAVNGCNSYSLHNKQSKPLSFFSRNDILRYIQIHNLDYCKEVYGEIIPSKNGLKTKLLSRTGCAGCPIGQSRSTGERKFIFLALKYPKLYKYLLDTIEMRPFLEYFDIPH